MKIFITGATGFIGEKLALKLAAEGHTVHALYRSEAKIKSIVHANIRWFSGDITDIASIDAAMLGCQQVYHIAAYAAVWEQRPGDFTRINVQGTLNVLDTARKYGINNIVVTSTAGIFGPSLPHVITENTMSPLPQFTGYERSKLQVGQLISERVKNGENIVVVNPTRVFGPGALNESNSVTKLISSYIFGNWRYIPGNGESIGNYVFVDDVVNCHILAMQKGKAGQQYIAGGDNVSYNTFFTTVAELSEKKKRMFHLPLWLMLGFAYALLLLNKIFKTAPAITPAHVRKFHYNWVVSSDKAKHELGYQPHAFRDAIQITVAWCRQQ